MKRIFLMMLALVMLLGCACGQGSETDLPDTVETEPLTESESVAETETESETEAPETEAPETEAEPQPVKYTFVKPEISEELKKSYYSYLYESWRQKVEEINSAQGDDFTFLVHTDPHFWVESSKQVANSAKALSHYADLDFIAVPGDLIRGYAYDEDNPANAVKCLDEVTLRYTENVNCPVLMTFGNHDTNAMWCKEFGTADNQLNRYDHYFGVTEKLKALNGDSMVTEKLCNYYYMDFPDDGIRVVMLNTTDGDYFDTYDSLSNISERQAEWFRDKALDTDLSVLVIAHIPLLSEFPENNSAPNGSRAILNAVESFVAAGGDFIAYMYGHVHTQQSMVDANGRLHVSFHGGATVGEVVYINTADRTIRTVGVGKQPVSRSFTYGK